MEPTTDYAKMYFLLFNAITVALEQLAHQNTGAAEELLRKAQIKTEEIYVDA